MLLTFYLRYEKKESIKSSDGCSSVHHPDGVGDIGSDMMELVELKETKTQCVCRNQDLLTEDDPQTSFMEEPLFFCIAAQKETWLRSAP